MRVTVQVSVAAFVSEALAQLKLLGTANPVPLRLTAEVVPVEELLVRVSFPVVAPAVMGLKAIARVADFPAASVNGKLAPERVKPVPLNDSALIVTEPVPDEVSVMDWEAVAATFIVPKFTLLALTANVDVVAAPRLIE